MNEQANREYARTLAAARAEAKTTLLTLNPQSQRAEDLRTLLARYSTMD